MHALQEAEMLKAQCLDAQRQQQSKELQLEQLEKRLQEVLLTLFFRLLKLILYI